MSGRWFGRRGRIALLVALLIAWGTVLYATRPQGNSVTAASARAASAPAVMPPAAPASAAASALPASGAGGGPAAHRH